MMTLFWFGLLMVLIFGVAAVRSALLIAVGIAGMACFGLLLCLLLAPRVLENAVVWVGTPHPAQQTAAQQPGRSTIASLDELMKPAAPASPTTPAPSDDETMTLKQFLDRNGLGSGH